MFVEPMKIPDVCLIRPRVHRDPRGYFSETYNQAEWSRAGMDTRFVQDNHAMSRDAGVVRGLHYQIAPFPQGKLVRVVRGAIFDVAVDIRHGSPTFGQHVSATLSAENWHQLWVPAGFAHGYCTLQPDTEVIYKVTHAYAPECERAIAWDDPDLGIAWPVQSSAAVLSDKDRRNPRFRDLPAARNFHV